MPKTSTKDSYPGFLSRRDVFVAVAVAIGLSSSAVGAWWLPLAGAVAPVEQIAPSQGDGPHAPANRPVARPVVKTTGGVTSATFDFGNVDVSPQRGQFSTPVRGTVYLPSNSKSPAPLVFFHHLRADTCTKQTMAYPCPKGTVEYRWDNGMEYSGKYLATQGYAVVIPDLSPVLVGDSSTGAYDQERAYVTVDSAIRTKLTQANAGNAAILGTNAKGRMNLNTIALIGHSRSGMLQDGVAKAWGPSVKSLMTLGSAYDTFEPKAQPFTRAGVDLPYFALVGERDGDTKHATNQWLSEHIAVQRKSPAFVATVPGLGHNFFNDVAVKHNLDDRKSCDSDPCKPAAAHRDMLNRSAVAWLHLTLRGTPHVDFPMTPSAPLTYRMGGQPAHVLAVTPGSAQRLTAGAKADGGAFQNRGAKVSLCSFREFGDNRPGPRCTEPDDGVVASVGTSVRIITWSGQQGVSYRIEPKPYGVKGLAVHVTPFGDRRGGTPLTVKVTDRAGKTAAVALPGTHPVLMNRATPATSGTYPMGTIRLQAAAFKGVDLQSLVSVTLSGAGKPATVVLRGIDIL